MFFSLETSYSYEMSDRVPINGSCLDMCPERERKLRERQRLLHMFEVKEGTENDVKPQADKRKTVKQFSRSAAGQRKQDPSDLRPSHILLRTVTYLVKYILPRTDVPWNVVYDFVNDRIQSVRQDMTLQVIEDRNAIQILEKSVRFYLVSYWELCTEPLSNFDPFLNNKELLVSLKRLLKMYDNVVVTHSDVRKGHDEFLAMYCLINLGCNETLHYVVSTSNGMDDCSNSKQAIKLSLAYMNGDFLRQFRMMRKLPIGLMLCIFQHVARLRHQALLVMCAAYSSKLCRFPLDVLSKWLNFCNTEETKSCCQHYGIKVSDNFAHFQKQDFDHNATVFIIKDSFFKKCFKFSTADLINGTFV